MSGAGGGHRCGAVLILVVGLIAILATIATAFLARSRGTSTVGEDAIRLAQSRIMLNAALTYIREASRLGYAGVEADGDVAAGDLLLDVHQEAWGWIDTRVIVPDPFPGSQRGGKRIGPNNSAGAELYPTGASTGPTRFDEWPAPGGVMRAPMYCMQRPPFAITQDYVRNPVPTDISQPTFGIPFISNPDPTPLLPDGSYFDQTDPSDEGRTTSSQPPSAPVRTGGAAAAARKTWAEGDRTPVPGTADLAWYRIYRERISPVDPTDPHSPLQQDDKVINGIPDGTGICTFIVTVGAGGSRGYRDWREVQQDRAEGSFGNSQALFAEIVDREQRQWFRVGWSAAVGGGEDLSVKPSIEKGGRGPTMSHYEAGHINASRWYADDIVGQSQPRNYGGTISFIQRLDGPPSREHW